LVLYHLIADGENGPEAYLCATTRSQAALVFLETVAMINANPYLKKLLGKHIKDSFHSKEIKYPKVNGKIVVCSGVSGANDGPSSSLCVFDELHRVEDGGKLFKVMEFSGSARDQPICPFVITTAGEDKQSICYKQHEYARKVIDSIVVDPGFLGMIFGLEEGEDHSDPVNWRKACPSMGHTIDEQQFALEYRQAMEDPSTINNFLRLRLGVWCQDDFKFIDMNKWKACSEPFDESILKGHPCYGGIDLASVDDTCSLCLLWIIDDIFYCKFWFWLPEDNRAKREADMRFPLLQTSRDPKNNLTLTPGDVIDYTFIEKVIIDQCNEHDIYKILCDPWNATQFVLNLQAQAVPIDFIRQSNATMNSPMQSLTVLLSQGKIRVGDNALMLWQASNAVAVPDRDGLLRLGKGKNRTKVDGVQALLNALTIAMVDQGMTANILIVGDQDSKPK
jgi:phage terminase large subunit-like protein